MATLPTTRLLRISVLALLTSAIDTPAQQPVLRSYRDLKVYTTSAPDPNQVDRITARTQFVNEGPIPLRIDAQLEARSIYVAGGSRSALHFNGGHFTGKLAPGQSKTWSWSFNVSSNLQRQVLSGSIRLNKKQERDLHILVLGTDAPGGPDKGLEKITEPARVVATYAPRTQQSIEAELAQGRKGQPKPALTLAADGKSDYTIVLETRPDDETIADLQRVIKLQSGAELPVRVDGERKTEGGPAIILQRVDLGETAAGLYDAYRLRTVGRDVIIEAASPEGLRNGIYGLLTDHLGAHWFQPGGLGEEIRIPESKTVRLPALNEVRGSRWSSSNGASWGKAASWDRRNRAVINRGRMSFGHNWTSFINPKKYPFEKYPEYYARDRQGNVRQQSSDANFCSTHPEVIELVAKEVNQYFTNEPQGVIYSLDPNDYAAMCLCDRCLALDKQYGQMEEDGRNVADRLLHFSREIHDRLEPKFKDKFLGILVYAFQIELPKSAQPHPHHAGLICDMVWVYDHSRPWNDPTSSLNRHFHDLVKGWGKLLPQFGYYDYYGHWTYPGPWGMVHKMREDLPAFRDLGGTYAMSEAQANFATQGLNHYVLAQLMWDLETDVDMAMEEFFRGYYGPLAAEMRDYWLTTERLYALERPSVNNPPRAALRPEFWRILNDRLMRAMAAAAKLSTDQKRFADRVQITADGFAYAQRHFDYHRDFGEYAGNKKVDHQAAIDFLRQHQAFFEGLQKKYSGGDGYWPPLMAAHLAFEIEPMIKNHESHLPKAQATKGVGQNDVGPE